MATRVKICFSYSVALAYFVYLRKLFSKILSSAEVSLMLDWLIAIGSILLTNLMLSGDNLVIIALACKELPEQQRRQAVIWGCFCIVAFRVVLTFVATYILDIPYLKLLGGAALLWIAVDLFDKKGGQVSCDQAASLKDAIKVMVIADLIISLDNVLVIAGIAQTVPDSKYSVIIFGLATSIPIIAVGAQLFMKLMDRFAILIYIGAGILGFTGSEMIVDEKMVGPLIAVYKGYVECGLTAAVIALGYWKRTWHQKANSQNDRRTAE